MARLEIRAPFPFGVEAAPEGCRRSPKRLVMTIACVGDRREFAPPSRPPRALDEADSLPPASSRLRAAEGLVLRFFSGPPTTSSSVHDVTTCRHIWPLGLTSETPGSYASCALEGVAEPLSNRLEFLHYRRSEAEVGGALLTGQRCARSNRIPQAVVVAAQGAPQPLVETVWTNGRKSRDAKGLSFGPGTLGAARTRATEEKGRRRAGHRPAADGSFRLLFGNYGKSLSFSHGRGAVAGGGTWH